MKQLSVCLGLLFATSFLFAQEAVQENVTIVETTEDRNSLLWKITGNELEEPSYLFGTIHMIGKEDYIFNEKMQAAFDACEDVVFEIKIDDMMDLGAQMGMMSKVFMGGGKTLKDLLSEEDYNAVKDHFQKMGMPLMFLERMKPMFLSAMASGDMSPESMNSGEVVSYELELMEMAQKEEKPIAGLETMEYQISIFDSIPYDVQAKMLVESIKSTDSGDDQFKQMVDLYKSQNIEAMQSMATDEDSGFGDYETLLLTQRNENWIPIMQEMMGQKRTFFAVGAGHLGGKKGVIKLLEEEGYTLEPIK